MKGMKKRVLALVLVIAMILTNAMLVSAEETQTEPCKHTNVSTWETNYNWSMDGKISCELVTQCMNCSTEISRETVEFYEYGVEIVGYGADLVYKLNEGLGTPENPIYTEVVESGFNTRLNDKDGTIREQLDGMFLLEKNPTKAGATFEGWAKFYWEAESDEEYAPMKAVFQKKSVAEPYYTLDEMLDETPTRNVMYAAKWSNIPIEEYHNQDYSLDFWTYDDSAEFEYYLATYDGETNEIAWEKAEDGYATSSLCMGLSIGSQIKDSVKFDKNPTLAGETFEGWAMFKYDRETGKYIFMPKSDEKQYYTMEEIWAMDMPAYDVSFVAKWSGTPIEDYYPYYYNVLLNANGGEVTTIFNYSDGTVDKYYEKIRNLGIREGKTLKETLVKDDIEITGINNAGKVLDSWKVYQAENLQLVGVMEGETAPKSDANQLVTHYDTVIHEDNTKADVYVVIKGYKLIDEAMSTEKLFNECKNSNFYAIANWKDSVTVVEDTKVKESLANEQKAVVDAIAKGTVKETVVSKETAENVKAAVEAGKEINTELVVYPMDETLIDSKEKADILNKVSDELGSGAKVQYLDIQVLLKADDDVLGNINELQSEIAITVAIPKEMKADGAEYVVIRNHDDKIDVLPATVNADGTVTFKTDRFSTYALAYVEETATSSRPASPATGDSNMILGYTLACVAALAVVVVLKKREDFVK